MNREQKRAAQRAGTANADGTPAAVPRDRRAPAKTLKDERTAPRQFVREVVAELRKTSWPTRQETIRLAIIVFIAIVVMTAFIFGVDAASGKLLTNLFDTTTDNAASAFVLAPLALLKRAQP